MPVQKFAPLTKDFPSLTAMLMSPSRLAMGAGQRLVDQRRVPGAQGQLLFRSGE